MVFGHKNKFQIDLGDLQNEKERLASFLQTNKDASVSATSNKLVVESDKLSAIDLQKEVTKYVHRHNLSRTHWVSTQDKTVKINRFETAKKKQEKHKTAPHQSITQSWGL